MGLPDNANQAFRLAYDKLYQYYPPENTAEFAKMVLDDFRQQYVASGEDQLVKSLLYGVYDYLDRVARQTAMAEYDRQKQEGNVT